MRAFRVGDCEFLRERVLKRRPTVQLISHSPGTHIQQVYTGLAMLRREGRIDLTQAFVDGCTDRTEAPQHLRDAAVTHARAILNDSVRVHYDMHDAQEIDRRDLDACDVYFKRSYSKAYAETLAQDAGKVVPFGLNYHVFPDFPDPLGVRRVAHFRDHPKGRLFALREALDTQNWLTFHARVRMLEADPDPTLPPRVLFLATAYDPHDRADRSPEKCEERHHNNEVRAQCIRRLRKELGPAFLGGFNRNAYTAREYQDCLATDDRVTDKKNYIRALKSHPICIATTGLHGSIGWKFAEYVACARAIVSEPLVYDVPGDLAAERNYLEFRTPDECAAQAMKLVEDSALREAMMTANARYYRAWLRPDVLLLNSLETAQRLAENSDRPRPIP